MFFPLGALGAFGGQFFPGMESGMDVSGKLAALGGQDAFMKALQQAQLGGAENLTPQGGFTPDPGVSSERSQMPTPQAPMAPMQPGMAPPQGGFAGSIPGAQAPPQQPGGAQPPGVPPMQRTASADPSGGMSPIDSPHVLAVKGFEGYSPRATWDYKQYSGGYGTRATPGQQFTPQSADSALQDEWYKAKTAVDRFAPGLPQGPRDALTSLTFNAGTNWMNDRLGKAVRAGDMQTAAQLLQQYNHAGGRPLPGLTQRRQEEGRWMLGQPPSPQALAAGRQAEARAAGQPQGQGAPDRTDAAVLSKAVENLRSGNLLPLQQMAQLIERANPGASPQVKFQALKQGLNLMNQSGQTQFNQMMQIMQYQQRERMHQDTLTKQQQMEEHRQAIEDIRERNYLRRDPYYTREADAAKTAQKNLTNNELRTEKVSGHIAALSKVAEQVAITGNVSLDTWLRDAQSKLGWPQEKYVQYKAMLDLLKSELGAMGAQTLGALSVSAKKDADALAHGIMTSTMLKSLEEAVKIDSKITREASQKLIKKHQSNMDYFMRNKGLVPEEELEEETPATGAGTSAPASSEGWGKATVRP